MADRECHPRGEEQARGGGTQYYRDRCKYEGSKEGGLNITGIDVPGKCEGSKEGELNITEIDV